MRHTTERISMLMLTIFLYLLVMCDGKPNYNKEHLVKLCKRKVIGRYPDVQNCKKYYVCSGKKLLHRSCTGTLLFDYKGLKCTLPDFTECADKSLFIRYTEPKVTKINGNVGVVQKELPGKLIKALSRDLADLATSISYPGCIQDYYTFVYRFGATYEYKKSKFEISNENFSSDVQSQAVCESICGNLATVENAREEKFIRGVIKRNNIDCLLIAGTDVEQSGQFVVAKTKKPIKYFHLASANDKRNGEDNHCLFYKKDVNGMIKMPCSKQEMDCRFLCKM